MTVEHCDKLEFSELVVSRELLVVRKALTSPERGGEPPDGGGGVFYCNCRTPQSRLRRASPPFRGAKG